MTYQIDTTTPQETEETTRVTKQSLIDSIAKDLNVSRKDVTAVINSFIDDVTTALVEGKEVSLPSFGIFRVKDRDAREARNPKTGETVQVDARKAVSFKASTALKREINK